MATIKQKLALKEILENHSSISSAMIKAGYKPTTATVPGNMTKTRGWKELLDEYLPDDKLLTVHEKALHAQKWNDFTGEREDDHNVQLKAVDMAYKVKGKIVETHLQQFNVGGDMTLEFLDKDGNKVT